MAAGADPKARTSNGQTPLHMAARESNPAVVEALLAAGADPKVRDENGQLPFDCAELNDRLQGTNIYWQLNDARFD